MGCTWVIGVGMLALIATASPAPARAAAEGPDAARDHEAAADKLLAKHDLRGAEVEFKNALKTAPRDAQVRIKLSRVELGLNEFEAAQVDLRAAAGDGGDEALIVPLLARLYLTQGKFEDLLRDMPAREDGPPLVRAETLAARADALAAMNNFDDALSALEAAEQLAPDASGPKLAIARLEYAHKQLDDALRKVEEILRDTPRTDQNGRWADARVLKGQILIDKGDNAGALMEMNAALAANPANAAALEERAQLYIAQDQDAKANADIKAALAITPRAIAPRYFQALLLTRAKNFAAADTSLTKYAQGFAAFPRAYLLQAIVKTALGQYEQARAAINLYLAAAPNDLAGEKVEADIMMRMENFAGAADVLERAVLRNPTDAEALEMLGRAFGPINAYRSVEAFQKAANLDPDSLAAVRGLALDSILMGRDAAGAAGLKKILTAAPNDRDAAERLIQLDLRDRKYDEAAKLAADLIKQHPDDPGAADAAGVIQLAQSDIAQARIEFLAVERKFPDFLMVKSQLGDLYADAGEDDKARAEYQAVLAKDPANAAALAGLSAIMAGEGQSGEQILELWKKAYRASPEDRQIETGLIHAYRFDNDLAGGLSAVRDMLVRKPREPSLFEMRAQLEMDRKNYKEAIDTLERLTELQPGNPEPLRQLASVQEAAGDYSGAAATIAAARKLDPVNVTLAADEARILGESDPAEGIAAAEKFAALLPDNADAQAMPGDYLVFIKRPADALAAYQRAYQAHPSLTLAKRLSDFALKNGESARGEKILSDWAASHAGDVAARTELAVFLQAERNFAAAAIVYEPLVSQFPDDPVLSNNLAICYQAKGDSRALALARKAHAAAPGDPRIDDTLGWIMVQKGDVANGVILLRRAHMLAPDNLNIEYHLASGLGALGKTADAAGLLKSAIASGADFDGRPDAQGLLARLSRN